MAMIETSLKKALRAALESEILDRGCGIPFGQLYYSYPKMLTLDTYSHRYLDAAKLYLINTEEDIELGSTVLPIYTDEEVDNNKIVGIGNNRMAAINADSKSGYRICPLGTHLNNNFVNARQYRWDAEYGNGEHNKICHGIIGGISVALDITPEVELGTGRSWAAYKYLRPGISGITAANEILLTSPGGSGARWVVNLETLVPPVALDSGDPRYDLPCGDIDKYQAIKNGKLVYSVDNYCKIFDISTKTTVATLGNASAGVAYDGTDVYHAYYNHSFGALVLYTVNVDANTESSVNVSAEIMDTFGISWSDIQYIRIGNIGNDMVMAYDDNDPTSSRPKMCYRITSIVAVDESITSKTKDIGNTAVCGYIINGIETKLFVSKYCIPTSRLSEVDNSSYVSLNYQYCNVCISREGWWGNMLAYEELEEPKDKDNTMVIDYAVSNRGL